MKTNPEVRLNEIVVQKSGEETLVYDLTKNQAYCLNETSALIYQLCDGNHSVAEIRDEMSRRLKILISDDFVNLALNQLSKDGLLKHRADDQFDGLSRRQVIRKLGITSLAVLPAISLIVAPSAVAAQSCLANGTPLIFPNPNPTFQPSIQACSDYCFTSGLGNPEAECCSGFARAGAGLTAGVCTCIQYACNNRL